MVFLTKLFILEIRHVRIGLSTGLYANGGGHPMAVHA